MFNLNSHDSTHRLLKVLTVYTSVKTILIFAVFLLFLQLDRLTEQELFMELIRDISTELDIDTLCHKILVNVGHLTHADRASLFLAQGTKSNRYLVAKLFDVTVDSGKFFLQFFLLNLFLLSIIY